MTNYPNRSWYQFSLRSLLITVSAVCIVSARIAYLQSMAKHHERQASRYTARMDEEMWRSSGSLISSSWVPKREDFVGERYNLRLAKSYRAAVYHPWTFIYEPRHPEQEP